jgi:signal transduction histidine kinase
MGEIMSVFSNGSFADSTRQQPQANQVESSRSSSLEPNNVPVKTFSLTRRIIAAVVTCQLLMAVGLTLVAVLYARAQLRASFDTALDGDALGALALVRYTETKPPVLMFDSKLLPPSSDQVHKDLYEIRAADGHLIARSNGWQAVPSEVTQTEGGHADFTQDGAPYRAVLLRNVPVLDSEDVESDDSGPPEKVAVIYASSLAESHERLATLAVYVGLTSLLLLLIANSIAIFSIRRGLDPLHELAERAGAISVHNWDFRPSTGAWLASELAPLASAIETVLARLKESFRQQRDFTNDAAHELKTSVAIVKSTVQSLLHRPRTQREYEIGLEGVLEDCGRLEDLLGRMLRLARIEQWRETGTPRKMATTELTSTCEAAIERMRTLAAERNVSLEFEGPVAVSIRADPEDLELIWLNLLENAVQYSPPGAAVKIRVQPNGGRMTEVSVSDAGPGIPVSELPHIFERFHRGDPSRARSTGGFGLGLAICKALVGAYGGRIEAINLPGNGTQVRVHLPV